MLNVQELIVDEVFHVPQAQIFCNNTLTYNDKITTPPGLYIVSWLLHYKDCSLMFLRLTNVLYALLTPLVLMGILGDWESAVELSLFPVAFFFHFLYYTDSGSLFWVLVSLKASKTGHYNISALCSFVAIWYRQNNIIWMFLIMGLSIESIKGHKEGSFSQQLYDYLTFTVKNLLLLIRKLWGFVLNCILFGLFLLWNQGIVIGDKMNHVVALHVPQLYYFSVFTVFFSWDYPLVWNALVIPRPIHLLIMVIMGWTVFSYTYVLTLIEGLNMHFCCLIIGILASIYGAGSLEEIL